MTDKELKKQLKLAYRLPASERQKRFLRDHEERSLQFSSILRIEIQHMGIHGMLAGALIFLAMYAGHRSESPEISWFLSCLIPAAALMPLTSMRRSERFGMAELEAASRFSYPYVRLVRLLILGVFSIAILPASCIWQASFLHTDIYIMLFTTAVPYLLNVYSGLVITRKWHCPESVHAVIAVGLATSLLPLLLRRIQQSGVVSAGAAAGILAIVFIAVIRECIIYMKESKKISWNLC